MYLHPEEKIIEGVIETYMTVLSEGFSPVLLYSGGKDSEVCLGAFLVAHQRLVKKNIKPNKSYLLTSDTLVENPEVDNLKSYKLSKLKEYCELNSIPLEIRVSKPAIMSSFQARVIGGRGLPTTVSSTYRQCTHELKISNNEKELRQLKANLSKEEQEKLFLVLGSRDQEGTIRANNIAKQNGAKDALTKGTSGENFLYPIKHLEVDEVWYFLSYAGNGSRKKWMSYLNNHDETIELYKDSAGECVILQPDSNEDDITSKNHSSCGARHGCWSCLAMGDSGDKSMKQFLTQDRYSYMQPLNDIRNYLQEVLKDYTKRRVAGRTINHGHIKLQPDCLSASECRKLLKACLTADQQELFRADEVSEKIRNKKIIATEYNLRMSKPQFQIISPEHLIAIDWNWMLIGLFEQPHEALKVLQEVVVDCDYLYLEKLSNEKEPMPPARYLPVGTSWFDNYELEGLSSPLAALLDDSSGCLSSTIITNKITGKKKVVQGFNLEDSFTIDPYGAEMLLNFDLDRLIEKRNSYNTPNEGIHTYMRYGTVSIPQRMIHKYDEMVARGAKFRKLGLSADLTWKDVATMGISKEDYNKIESLMKIAKVSKSYLLPETGSVEHIINKALEVVTKDITDYIEKHIIADIAQKNHTSFLYRQHLDTLQFGIEQYIDSCNDVFLHINKGVKFFGLECTGTKGLKALNVAKINYNSIKKAAIEHAVTSIHKKINNLRLDGASDILDTLITSKTILPGTITSIIDDFENIFGVIKITQIDNKDIYKHKPSILNLSVFR
jgi:3'-phosphoadenosine 5'-phosphosulfate sulfotransferase (PAPS reductase)/FAD synthetase